MQKISLFIILGYLFSFSQISIAASQDECSIWLCLPTGFPSGFGGAKSAFKKRIKKFKPPLPSFSACKASDSLLKQLGVTPSQMSYNHHFAALIREHQVCERWDYSGDTETCRSWRTVPSHYVKNRRCVIGNESSISRPASCTVTYRYVDVFIDGKKTGETYYWK